MLNKTGRQFAILRLLSALIFLLVFIIASQVYRSDWSDDLIVESKLRGDEIAVALEKYFRDHSYYPDSLTSLVPKYIESIKQPVAGKRQWEYSLTKDKRIFNLLFSENGNEPRRFGKVTNSDHWDYDSGN